MGRVLPGLFFALLGWLALGASAFAYQDTASWRLSLPSVGNQAFSYHVFKAYQFAYPSRNLQVEWRGQDWGIAVDGRWYLWSEGRLLPEAETLEPGSFSRYSIYRYPHRLPPQPIFTATAEKAFRQSLEQRLAPYPVHRGFIGDLYQIRSRAEAESQLQLMFLAGKKVRLNQILKPVMLELDLAVTRLRKEDQQTDRFLRRVKAVSGFNWRDVSFFGSVSYHSFGLALDFLPAKWEAPVYWFWSKELRDDWYNIPYRKRWQVPQRLVELFESYGFLWGGKWLFFDNMHFEYRPELLELRKLPPEQWPRPGYTEQLAEQPEEDGQSESLPPTAIQ